MAQKQVIVKAARCIFPEGKAVLMGYNAEGKEVFGLGIKAQSAHKWASQGVSKADLERVKREYDKWHAEAAAEAAAE